MTLWKAVIVGLVGIGAAAISGCGTEAMMDMPGASQSDAVALSGEQGLATVQAAMIMGGAEHDVASIRVAIYEGNACMGTLAGEDEVMLSDVGLGDWMDPDHTIGDNHPFVSALFVLPEGEYTACAQPLTDVGAPSAECLATFGNFDITAGETTDYLLISQCLVSQNGTGVATVALNDAPVIDDVVVSDGLITPCEAGTITTNASDLNNDPIVYLYLITDKPAGANANIVGVGNAVSFNADMPGEYEITVTVSDPWNGFSSLSFPLDVLPCP